MNAVFNQDEKTLGWKPSRWEGEKGDSGEDSSRKWKIRVSDNVTKLLWNLALILKHFTP